MPSKQYVLNHCIIEDTILEVTWELVSTGVETRLSQDQAWGWGQDSAVGLWFVIRHFIQLSHSWLLMPAGPLPAPSHFSASNHNQML